MIRLTFLALLCLVVISRIDGKSVSEQLAEDLQGEFENLLHQKSTDQINTPLL